MRDVILVIFISVMALACLAGCPGQSKPGGSAGNSSTASPQPSPAQDVSTAGAAAPETTDGSPAAPTSNIVLPVQGTVAINQPFKVSYELVQASTGDAWIALVPSAVTSLTLQDNITQAVDRVTLPVGASGTIELTARQPGKYALRLFPAQTGEILAVAEAEVIVEESLPDEELAFTPPYVTITGKKLRDTPVQITGFPMIAYWEMAEPQGSDAWIGMIPTSCTAQDAAANLEAAVDVQFLNGKTKESSIFLLTQPGEFLFRIFSSKAAPQMLCESQTFRVRERPAKPTEQVE